MDTLRRIYWDARLRARQDDAAVAADLTKAADAGGMLESILGGLQGLRGQSPDTVAMLAPLFQGVLGPLGQTPLGFPFAMLANNWLTGSPHLARAFNQQASDPEPTTAYARWAASRPASPTGPAPWSPAPGSAYGRPFGLAEVRNFYGSAAGSDLPGSPPSYGGYGSYGGARGPGAGLAGATSFSGLRGTASSLPPPPGSGGAAKPGPIGFTGGVKSAAFDFSGMSPLKGALPDTKLWMNDALKGSTRPVSAFMDETTVPSATTPAGPSAASSPSFSGFGAPAGQVGSAFWSGVHNASVNPFVNLATLPLGMFGGAAPAMPPRPPGMPALPWSTTPPPHPSTLPPPHPLAGPARPPVAPPRNWSLGGVLGRVGMAAPFALDLARVGSAYGGGGLEGGRDLAERDLDEWFGVLPAAESLVERNPGSPAAALYEPLGGPTADVLRNIDPFNEQGIVGTGVSYLNPFTHFQNIPGPVGDVMAYANPVNIAKRVGNFGLNALSLAFKPFSIANGMIQHVAQPVEQIAATTEAERRITPEAARLHESDPRNIAHPLETLPYWDAYNRNLGWLDRGPTVSPSVAGLRAWAERLEGSPRPVTAAEHYALNLARDPHPLSIGEAELRRLHGMIMAERQARLGGVDIPTGDMGTPEAAAQERWRRWLPGLPAPTTPAAPTPVGPPVLTPWQQQFADSMSRMSSPFAGLNPMSGIF